ncbi:hypothetical protein P12x_000984 [Tundrisphaera lichenicola]|uniref:hypothetical protein n=1 Tax=Tundrisphaera lichenicola TaxID=2029860 RepID=UPI003EB90A3E
MRFSIGRLMLLVVLAASNLVAYRFLDQIQSRRDFLVLLFLGAMPMIDMLLIAHSFKKPESRFLSGFVRAGWMALSCYVLVAAIFAEPMIRGVESLGNLIFGAGPFSLVMLSLLFLFWFSCYTIPQALLATIAGWLNRDYRIRILVERRPESGSIPTA